MYTHFRILIKVKLRVENKFRCVDITHPTRNIEMATNSGIGTDENFAACACIVESIKTASRCRNIFRAYDDASA